MWTPDFVLAAAFVRARLQPSHLDAKSNKALAAAGLAYDLLCKGYGRARSPASSRRLGKKTVEGLRAFS